MGYRPSFLAISAAIACVLFVVGLFYFRKTEKRFADIA
jgi:ABC-type polysaccharide/polyol phosphate export permease